MRIISFIPLIVICFYCSVNSQPVKKKGNHTKAIEVQFNKNIEFLGFTYFLGSLGKRYENTEELTANNIKKKDWYGYHLSFYTQYKSFADNKNLLTITQVLEPTDAVPLILLFVQVDDFPNARLDGIEEQYIIPFSETNDPAEARKKVTVFIEALNQFYKEVNFDEYFQTNKAKYDNALEQVKRGMPPDNFIPAMEAFYQNQFDHYILIPSLTIPTGMGFGPRYMSNGKTRILNVFGPLDVQHFGDDSQLDMGFGDKKRLRELSTHEFGHSFVNPVMNKVPEELIAETQKLFDPLKTAMEDQGYNDWETSLDEHVVRAGEVIIARDLGNTKEADDLQRHYIEDRKFIYLPVILEELEKYNKGRNISYEEAVFRALERLKEKVKKND